MTEFTQLYLTPKIFLMGSTLAFSLKEDPVRCAKVCDKSWVILMRCPYIWPKIENPYLKLVWGTLCFIYFVLDDCITLTQFCYSIVFCCYNCLDLPWEKFFLTCDGFFREEKNWSVNKTVTESFHLCLFNFPFVYQLYPKMVILAE